MANNNYIVLLLAALLTIIPLLAKPTTALMPYTPPHHLWEMMNFPITMDHLHQDPFRILEHTTPVPFPKETLALARADWKETPSSHLITLDIPGLKKDDVKIEVEENRVLRVSGEKKNKNEKEEEVEGEKWHRAERVNGKFLRQFRLPLNADLAKVQAHLEDGVLRIVVPKFAEEKKRQPKVININSHSSSGEDIKATKAEM